MNINSILVNIDIITYCRRCVNPFRFKDSLKDHVESCSNNEAVKITYPEKGSDISILKFKNINRFMRVPFVAYADFEAFIKPIHTKAYTIKLLLLH